MRDIAEIGIGIAYLTTFGRVTVERVKKEYRIVLKANFASYSAQATSLLDAINLVITKKEDMNSDD